MRNAAGESNRFGVEIGLHQGSALDPCVDIGYEKGRTWINDIELNLFQQQQQHDEITHQ